MHDASTVVVVAGVGGDLGSRIAKALLARGATVRAPVRQSTPQAKMDALVAAGVNPQATDFEDARSLERVCRGAACVVSALNGLAPVILETQTRLLDAAVAAGVPRFIPSDYSLDFTKTAPGGNRNLDLHRAFMARVADAPVRATSVLNGAFAELLTGGAPIVLRRSGKVLYWGSADQTYDFTTKDDVARYTALVALDEDAPRLLRIAGDVVTPRTLAALMASLTGRRFGLWRAGGIGRLSALIRVARALTPSGNAVFPAWQGMQYLRDMSIGQGKLEPLDNDRYGPLAWTTAGDVLRPVA